MAQTITPVVYGGRTKWLGALALHVIGATLTAVVFGAGLGLLGGLLGGVAIAGLTWTIAFRLGRLVVWHCRYLPET